MISLLTSIFYPKSHSKDQKGFKKRRHGSSKKTYLLEQRSLSALGPKNLKYFLKPNELLFLFKGFRILRYQEGIFKEGGKRKAIASLIAQKT